jgi:hypothetical protein
VAGQRTFVFGDVHGMIGLLKGLLLKAGVLERTGDGVYRRIEGFQVISIGDLVDGREFTAWSDRRLLERAPDWIDRIVVGNHELGFLGGLGFDSQWDDNEKSLRRRLRELASTGMIVPAFYEGETLITHAGLSSYFPYETAADAAAAITEAWHTERGGLLISGVGKDRWGDDVTGGVCWLDWRMARNPRFDQIVGHTPSGGVQSDSYVNGVRHLNIDVHGKSGRHLAGVFLENGKVTETVFYERVCDFDELDDEEMRPLLSRLQ